MILIRDIPDKIEREHARATQTNVPEQNTQSYCLKAATKGFFKL